MMNMPVKIRRLLPSKLTAPLGRRIQMHRVVDFPFRLSFLSLSLIVGAVVVVAVALVAVWSLVGHEQRSLSTS